MAPAETRFIGKNSFRNNLGKNGLKHFALSVLYLVVKTQQHFVTPSCMFLGGKIVLEIWLHPGLNLTIFRETGQRQKRIADV